MSKTRKRNAIHSGIGDQDDLLVKRPIQEDVTEDFQYAARLRGKKRHDTMIYPEVPFEYGVSYTGETLEVDNEQAYEFDINAHPEKSIAYRIEETKELPIQKLWEAQACFEGEIAKHNLKYALEYKGHTGVVDKRTAQYAVDWEGMYNLKNHGDAKDLFTNVRGQYVGYDDGTTGWKMNRTHVDDVRNRPFFSGTIAKRDDAGKSMYNWNAYEASFSFKPILNDGEGIFDGTKRFNWSTNHFYNAGKWDDDVVGMIFQAKDSRNFYMMMWEAEERIWKSSRAGDNLDGINIFTMKDEYVERSVIAEGYPPTRAQWIDHCNNHGWGRSHYRIYKVTNGVMRRVNVAMKGSGKGWVMNNMHRVRVIATGRNVRIFARTSPKSSEFEMFNFNADWSSGSFGMFNVSQSVEFHSIEVIERKILSGRIPESGWDSSQDTYKTIASNATSYVRNSDSFKRKLPSGISASSVKMMEIDGKIRNSANGTIGLHGLTGRIVVKAYDYTTRKNYSGRLPRTGWYEFDGIGDKLVATNAQNFIREKTGISDMLVSKVSGKVQSSKAGQLIVGSTTGSIVAKNNNAIDAGELYSKCYIRCDLVDITPDHRDFSSGLMVFDDIAKVFKFDYDEFFNRPDFVNKKATYELLKPVKKHPPKPPVQEDEEPSNCEPPIPKTPEGEELIDPCLNEFDFNGKRLIMWSCEFPIEKETKLFEDSVFAYQGWMTFNPLTAFGTPNKWTYYELIPIEATVNLLYDEIKWAAYDKLKKAPVGSKVIIRTKEWYRASFPADIVREGIVKHDQDIYSKIPPAPEHYWIPDSDEVDVANRMPDNFENIHFLLDAYENHSDVVIYFAGNPGLTTDNVSRNSLEAAKEGYPGLPIILTSNDNDQVVIHCKEDPRYLPWVSGKYIGYGKVNGKRPFFGDGSGKADMVNVPTDKVFFPSNLVREKLEGPFIDIYDQESPSYPRITFNLHTDDTLIDFSSDHQDAYIWYSDWYSKWAEVPSVHQTVMEHPVEVESPVDLDPTDPAISDDYDPANTLIERIEVTSSNPFVKLWIEEDKSPYSGLLGTYYRFPLTSTIYEEQFQVTGDYKEYTQAYTIESFMEEISIPITSYEPYTILTVSIDDVEIPTSGYAFANDTVTLKPESIAAGQLAILYSTGGVENVFYLEKGLGETIEVYINGALVDSAKYDIEGRYLTIAEEELYLNDWVNIQSYVINDRFDPSKRTYLGEKQYTQLDFQEDQPSEPTNPNYNDLYYEGALCFNWGYEAPARLMSEAIAAASFRPMYQFPSEIQFKYILDVEVVYPDTAPIDISNFTGEWVQWDIDPIVSESGLNGPGDWHGPPEEGYPEVTNLRNQSYLSGWYNPLHQEFKDYVFEFNVQARGGDDDMYGAIFKFDPATQNFYSFEWDGYWGLTPPSGGTGVKGMAIYKNICLNPEDSGIAKLNYKRTQLAHADISWMPSQSEIHKIRVSTIGNAIKVWTDDLLRFDIQDEVDPFTHGSWGPVTQSQPQTYFWNFWMENYKRVTYVEYYNFRKPMEFTQERPAMSNSEMVEIQVDPTTIQDAFLDTIADFCQERGISRSIIQAVDYFIKEDQSEYPVYFKEGGSMEQVLATKVGESTVYATVRAQNPEVDPATRVVIPTPKNPEIPVLQPPTKLNPKDGFTISWNGYIFAEETGVYRFKATANDGYRLTVASTEVINEWHVTGEPSYFPDYEGSIYLEGNKWHPITIQYFDNEGQALMRMHWATPGKEYRRISPDVLTPYLGYRLFAQVKKARPLPWSPLVHNGYYYHEEREHHLYAEKQVLRKTPNLFHEVSVEPRPQQGSALIVRDNEGNNLRKVTFYDEDWNLTLENKEAFTGNGYAKYYLNYKGIDRASIKVSVNGVPLMNADYIFNEEESSVEFMERLGFEDEIEIRYILLYSYFLDMNADMVNGFVNRDRAKLKLHSNYDPEKMSNMEIIYETAKETPFYRAEEAIINPLLNHNHTGFLYITEVTEQTVKELTLNLSEETLSNSGKEKVLLTAKVVDHLNNPVPNKIVKLSRDGIQLKELLTNEAGEVYLYDQPAPTAELISTYQVECEGIIQESLLNYFVKNEKQRIHLEVEAQKITIFGGVDDQATIRVTMRDENWNPVGSGYSIQVKKRNTYNVESSINYSTDSYGQVIITVSGLEEKHGNMMLKVSTDFGIESAANYIHLKVIGG